MSDDGLSTNYVNSIVQDDKGFMWFGTQDGLNKYDGYQIKVFKNDPTSVNSLSSSEVICIKQMRTDLIVVGTIIGINYLNPLTQVFTRISDNKELNVKINCISPLDKENILIGTEKGLFSMNVNQKKAKKISFKELDEVNVTSIFSEDKRSFLATRGNGLWLLENNSVSKVELVKPDYFNSDLKETMDLTDVKGYGGKLYLGTFGKGIFKVDPKDFEVESKIILDKDKDEFNFIKKIEIRDNKLFAATGYGVVIYDLISEKKAFYSKGTDKFSMNSLLANCIYFDNKNNMWVGTNLGGINVSFSQTLKFPLSNAGFESQDKDIYSFVEDKENEIWIGGVNLFKKINIRTGEVKDLSGKVKGNTILSICKENENVLWLGTWGNGLIRFDIKTGKTSNYLSNKLGGTVICLTINNGAIYAGTVGDGLFRINLNSPDVINFTTKDGLPHQNINRIFQDSKGFVWVGTYDGGLLKLKNFPSGKKLEIVQKYSTDGEKGQIASNIVLDINEDKNGNIWAATSSGLSKLLPGGSFFNFYEKDGLASSYLYSIVKDSLGNFWMSSNVGIIKFNPLVNEKEITFKNYSMKDGLVNQEYNMGAAMSATSGIMCFGGANGFNVFRPSSIKENLNPPQTYVISYKRGGQDVETDSLIAFKKHLNLSWRQNYFQLELVALDYTDPIKNKFRYKLEGYDNDWSAPSNVRYVSYTELPGGEYTFKVKSANNDGIWNETPYELHITVVPPFWKTKLFYILSSVFILAGIFGFTHYRTKAIKKVNKMLENKVAERTRELAEKNRDITSSIEYAKRIQEAILPSKEQMYKKLTNAFILYKPKDIVSGDFYWFGEKNSIKILAVVDCTGHGVPGAFMSMIGHNLMHQIVSEKGITDPGEILNNLHKGVQEALRQGQNEINTNDGMDVSLIAINDRTNEVKWAGANRSLVLVNSRGELLKYDGNKFPVGGAQLLTNRVFTTHDIKPETSSMAYMFTDGYADQFGGDKGKKYMVKKLHEILTTIHLHPSEKQKKELNENFERWKQNHEQVDDVLIVGLSI